MPTIVKCPICLGRNKAICRQGPSNFDGKAFNCERCGKYKISGTVIDDNNCLRGTELTDVQRVCLSQNIRIGQSQSEIPFIMSDWLRDFKKAAKLSLPPYQARRLIEYIGDHVSTYGTALASLPQAGHGEIGIFDLRALSILFQDLIADGLVSARLIQGSFGGLGHPVDLNLTLRGWTEYESLKGGMRPGNYGFLAMKFGDETLESFTSAHLKPYVKEQLGYDLVDIREVSKAGIIDNLLREQIRDSVFIIVDLTHDNSGAYWEAGYAEGLGKPVIYICEKAKFEKNQTHFDTNHCTTVMWSVEDPEDFQHKLVATLRRSLNLFPT